MRKTYGLLAAIAVLGVAPGVAHATKFWGTCDDISGTATFSNGVSNTQQDTNYDFAGTAHCDGAVGDQTLSQAPVHIHVSGPANVSCANGKSTGDGLGTITLDSTGQSVPFKMTFTATASEVTIAITGMAGGSGTGSASFFNKDPSHFQDNATTLKNCGTTDGNKSLSFTAKADVPKDTALDDGKSASAASPSGGQQPSGGDQPSQPSSSTSGSSTGSQPAAKPKKPKHHKKPKHRGKHKAKGHAKHKH
jgi:hypothetical protein